MTHANPTSNVQDDNADGSGVASCGTFVGIAASLQPHPLRWPLARYEGRHASPHTCPKEGNR